MAIYKLLDVINIKIGKKPNKNLDWYLRPDNYFGYPFPKQTDIENNWLNNTKLFFNTNEVKKTLLDDGRGIYFMPDAEVKIFKSKISFCMSPSIWRLDSKDENTLNKKFLFLILIKNKERIKELSHGTTIKHISLKDFRQFKLNIPKIDVQNQIISIIEPFEKQLIVFYKKINYLNDYIIRNYSINKGNKKESLLDVATLHLHKYNNQFFYSDTSIVGTSIIDLSKIEIIKTRKSRANLTPRRDSIIFSKLKSSNKFLPIYSNFYDNIVFSTGFFNLTSSINLYLYGFLLSNDFKQEKDANSTGTLMEGLNNNSLKKIKITLPRKDYIDNDGLLKLLTVYNFITNKIKLIIYKLIEILVS